MLNLSRSLTPSSQESLIKSMPDSVKKGLVWQHVFMVNERNLAAVNEATEKAEAKRKADDLKIPLGSKATDFTMNDTEGKPVSLSAFKGLM